MSIVLRGEVTAETRYPCMIQTGTLESGGGVYSLFYNPNFYFGEEFAPFVQLRKKERVHMLVYLTYDEDPDIHIEMLPEWWRDSKVVWELKADPRPE